jgi:hypothetical protein
VARLWPFACTGSAGKRPMILGSTDIASVKILSQSCPGRSGAAPHKVRWTSLKGADLRRTKRRGGDGRSRSRDSSPYRTATQRVAADQQSAGCWCTSEAGRCPDGLRITSGPCARMKGSEGTPPGKRTESCGRRRLYVDWAVNGPGRPPDAARIDELTPAPDWPEARSGARSAWSPPVAACRGVSD